MRYHQRPTSRRNTKGEVSILTLRMPWIVKCQRKRVAEDSGSFIEGNAVLLEIRSRLIRIPLTVHDDPRSVTLNARSTGSCYDLSCRVQRARLHNTPPFSKFSMQSGYNSACQPVTTRREVFRRQRLWCNPSGLSSKFLFAINLVRPASDASSSRPTSNPSATPTPVRYIESLLV